MTMFWGNFIITEEMLFSLEVSSSYRVVSGVKSSQFLGRESRSAKIVLRLRGRIQQRLAQLEAQIEAGNARGLEVNFALNRLEGLFAVTSWSKVLTQTLGDIPTFAVVELTMVEDVGQRVG